jgi:hypothetical protein
MAANAPFNPNFNGINQSPFFADPGVRSQLQLNNRQFNQLNAAYQRAFQRYAQGLAGPDSAAVRRQARRSGAGATGTAATNRGTGASNRGVGPSNTPIGTNPNANGATATAGLNPSDTVAQQQQQQHLARLRQLQNQFFTDFNPALDATFTDPALRQRFNQLNWQFLGVGAFNDPMIQQQLNLTAQQRQQLAALNGAWRRELMNLQRSSRNNLTQDQLNMLRAQFMNRVNAVLTPQQQQTWTSLVGQPYDFPVSSFFPAGPTNSRDNLGLDAQTGNQTQGTDAAARRNSSATQTPQTTPRTVR